jgi:hypothetical protein
MISKYEKWSRITTKFNIRHEKNKLQIKFMFKGQLNFVELFIYFVNYYFYLFIFVSYKLKS